MTFELDKNNYYLKNQPMKKLLLALTLSIVFISSSFSQEEPLKKMFKTDFNFSGLGFSYDIPIAEKWTVDLSAGIGAAHRANNGLNVEWILNEVPAAYFKSEFKYYYNREKRFKQGKNNANNSGNYWAFQSKYATERFSEPNIFSNSSTVLLNEVHWGMQRSLGGNWLFNTHFGLGYARDFTFDSGSIYPAIGIKFSYKIF
jgi:hypothetical protein